MFFWVTFRLCQLWRIIRSTGIGLLLTAIVITAGIWVQLLGFLASINGWQIAALSLAMTGWMHLKRSDQRFLEKGSNLVRTYCTLDYCLFLLPLMLILLALGQNYASVAMMTGLVWGVFPPGLLHQKNRAISQKLIPFLPVKAIEWRYIFRKQWLLIIGCIGLFAGTFWHPGFCFGGLLLLWLLVLSGFEFIEPVALLPCTRKEAFSRWRQSALILHVIAAPGYVFLCFHGTNYCLLALYACVANESLMLLCFAWKWATWYPGRYRQHNNITLSLSFLFLLLPGFVVIPLAQGIFYARKAISNLRLR